MRASILTVGILLLLGCLAKPSNKYGGVQLHVNTNTNRIEDDDGRERIFHGTNVVYKGPPYIPVTDHFDPFLSFSEQDMALLEEIGYNSIRLGVLWAGAEPQDGQFNETYFTELQKLVDKAASQYGIYSLLDMHQDDLNEKFCGEGVPNWASPVDFESNNFPLPLSFETFPVDPQTGWPNQTICDTIDWFEYQFTFALNSATGSLYSNKNGLRDKFSRFWKKVASLWSTSQNILGYELLNEPWAGDVISDPLLLVPGVADRENLQPMYEDIAKNIRMEDEVHLVFFQGVTWEVVGIGERWGFTDIPGGSPYRNRTVFAFHNSIVESITPDPRYYVLRWSEVQRLGCGGWVTESGSEQSDLTDQYSLSWMHWEYKAFIRKTGWSFGLYNEDGSLNEDQVKLYARTYPKAVAGSVVEFRFNASTGGALLVYDVRPSCQRPTEVYVSEKYYYPKGCAISISPPEAATYQYMKPNHIHIIHTKPVQPIRLQVKIDAL